MCFLDKFLNLNITDLLTLLGHDTRGRVPGWEVGWIVFGVVIWVFFVLFLSVLVYNDAERRGSNGLLWFIVVFFTMLLGLIIWLIVRPPKKERVERRVMVEKVLVCPYCRTENAPNTQFCSNCGSSLE